MMTSPTSKPRLADAGLPRRRLLLAAGLAVAAGPVGAAKAELPVATSLPEHLAAALKQGDPLVVMVSLHGCPFCQVARQSYLAPLLREQGLAIVQVDMNSALALRDFKGAMTTHDLQVRAWGIRIAPTVLFFGRDGVEAAKRLVGASIPDFYGAYLEQRLATARTSAVVTLSMPPMYRASQSRG